MSHPPPQFNYFNPSSSSQPPPQQQGGYLNTSSTTTAPPQAQQTQQQPFYPHPQQQAPPPTTNTFMPPSSSSSPAPPQHHQQQQQTTQYSSPMTPYGGGGVGVGGTTSYQPQPQPPVQQHQPSSSTYVASSAPPPPPSMNYYQQSSTAATTTMAAASTYDYEGGFSSSSQHQQQQYGPTTTTTNMDQMSHQMSTMSLSSQQQQQAPYQPSYQQQFQQNQQYAYQQPMQQPPMMQQPMQQQQQTAMPQNTSITTGNADTLPRPHRVNQLLYSVATSSSSGASSQQSSPQSSSSALRRQPDVSGLFARQARSHQIMTMMAQQQQQDQQHVQQQVQVPPPHDFNMAQSSTTFIRATVQCIPSTPSLAQKWHLPLGAVIHPFASGNGSDSSGDGNGGGDHVPVVSMGQAGIVRCAKCRTYINPFVLFVDYGKKWQCNMCKTVNDVPNAYYCPLDDNGVRRDYFRRPELLHGSVEFIAPQEYMARVPQPPAYLFLLDVSYNAVQSGLLRNASRAILSVLDQFPARTQIGFITFDSSIHFYNLKSSLTVPQMLVVGELEESLLPLPSDLLVNLQDSKTVVRSLLERLSAQGGMFHQTTNVESALGAAMNAAGRILGRIGGKLSIFLANLPTLGPNSLVNREDRAAYGNDSAEMALLNPIDNRFKEFALLYCRDQISVDLYAMAEQQSSSQYLDLASLNGLCKFTGGIVEYYSTDATEKLYGDVVRALTRETGFEAVMRVRASTGLKISNFYGNLFIRGHDLLALPNIDADKAFGIEFEHTGSFVSTPNASVQVAVLYTSSSGQRRIRVHNLVLPITAELSDMYKDVDLDATMNLMAKIAVDNVPRKGLTWVKNDIRDRVVRCLATYKQVVKQGVGFSQLVLPDSLRLLPLYACALTKQDALMGGQEVRADERIYAFSCLTTGNTWQTNLMIHPLAFAINEIDNGVNHYGGHHHHNSGSNSNNEDDEDEEDEDEEVDLNQLQLHPLSRKLVNTETAVILLTDGLVAYLWLAKQPMEDTNFVQDVSALVDSLNSPVHDDAEQQYRPTTSYARKIQSIVKGIRREVGHVVPVRFVNKNSGLWQRVFVRKLIEDKTIQTTMSYDEFLVHIHNNMK